MKLVFLKSGQSGTILSLQGPLSFTHRLLDLGFIPGTTVVIYRKAAWHGPLETMIRGYILALRYQEAMQIEVEVDENSTRW